MVCLYCSGKTQVINSRLQKRSNSVWRRRQCRVCRTIFSTQETAQYGAAWLVKTTTGQLHPFQRDKLFLSLYTSCRHRPTALTDAGALTDTVINTMAKSATTAGVLSSSAIKQAVQVALNRFDKSASVHYSAFHDH